MAKGKLTVYGGPMFAGKTSALISHAKHLDPQSFLIVKPSIDTRYSVNEIVTHNGDRLQSVSVNISALDFSSIRAESIHAVLIDELNFFDYRSLFPEIQVLLHRGIDIIGSGLLYDFQKHPFGATLELAKQADEFVELYAHCDRCNTKANHSYRKVHINDQVLLGAEESYGACCEICWEALQQQGAHQNRFVEPGLNST